MFFSVLKVILFILGCSSVLANSMTEQDNYDSSGNGYGEYDDNDPDWMTNYNSLEETPPCSEWNSVGECVLNDLEICC